MKRKIWSNRKFCTKVLDMVLTELKRQDCEQVIDIYQTKISIYVAPRDCPDGTEGKCVFSVDWNALYRDTHILKRASAYRIGKAAAIVLDNEIRRVLSEWK